MKDENGNSYERYNVFKNDAEFQGYVKARLETIVSIQKDHEKRIRKTEKAISRIMTTASAVGATFGIIFTIIGDWLKDILGLNK